MQNQNPDDFFNFNSVSQPREFIEDYSDVCNWTEYQNQATDQETNSPFVFDDYFDSPFPSQESQTRHSNTNQETSSQFGFGDSGDSTEVSGSPFTSEESQNMPQGEERRIVKLSRSPEAALSDSAESQPKKKKGSQSKYKNKYKASLEQARSIVKELLEWDAVYYADIIEEAEKENEMWEAEIRNLADSISQVAMTEEDIKGVEEMIEKIEKVEEWKRQNERQKEIRKELAQLRKQAKELKGKAKGAYGRREEKRIMKEEAELKKELDELEMNDESKEKKKDKRWLKKTMGKIQKEILEALRLKRYGCFAPLYEVQEDIRVLIEEGDAEYFQRCKKGSMVSFEQETMSEGELFYWIVMFKVAILLLPEEDGNLDMGRMTKENAALMCWLMDPKAKMKVKNKELFRMGEDRDHLRQELKKAYAKLRKRVERRMAREKRIALKSILGFLGDQACDLDDLEEESPRAEFTLNISSEDVRKFQDYDGFDLDFVYDKEVEESSMPRKMIKYA